MKTFDSFALADIESDYMDECDDPQTRLIKQAVTSRHLGLMQLNTPTKLWPDSDADFSFLTVPDDPCTDHAFDMRCL